MPTQHSSDQALLRAGVAKVDITCEPGGTYDELLPEKAKVYVVVPGISESGVQRVAHIPSPRLAHPEQANDFVKEVIDLKERTDAEL